MAKKPVALHILMPMGGSKGPAPKAPWDNDSDPGDESSSSAPEASPAAIAPDDSAEDSAMSAKLDQIIASIADLKSALMGSESDEETPSFGAAAPEPPAPGGVGGTPLPA